MYLSKKWLAVIAILTAVVAAIILVRTDKLTTEGSTASNDIPVVIRTNGGWLEVATIKHRRSFDLKKTAKFVGMEVPFCAETATYAVDVAITYRVKLAKRWVGDVSDNVLYLTVPPPEPAIPVAFDTAKLRATLNSCWFMPSLNAKDELLRSISTTLAKDAQGSRYKQFSRGKDSRATIAEFAHKWLLNQKRYDLPQDTKIEVSFSDE